MGVIENTKKTRSKAARALLEKTEAQVAEVEALRRESEAQREEMEARAREQAELDEFIRWLDEKDDKSKRGSKLKIRNSHEVKEERIVKNACIQKSNDIIT